MTVRDSRPEQPVMTLMFEARIDAMAKELAKMRPDELDAQALQTLHAQTCRLLRLQLPGAEQ